MAELLARLSMMRNGLHGAARAVTHARVPGIRRWKDLKALADHAVNLFADLRAVMNVSGVAIPEPRSAPHGWLVCRHDAGHIGRLALVAMSGRQHNISELVIEEFTRRTVDFHTLIVVEECP